MGQVISRVYLSAVRELKIYNVERRAEKVISKEKPTPAPKYPSTLKTLEKLEEENVSKEYLYKKDQQLDDHLKKVYVTTPDSVPSLKRPDNPLRPLPMLRHTYSEISYGYSDIEEHQVPQGKVSLKQALEFISDHKNDPETNTPASIAAKYKMPLNVTDDILTHFTVFDMRVNKKEGDQMKSSDYELLQERVKNMTVMNAKGIITDFKKSIKEFDKKLVDSFESSESSSTNVSRTDEKKATKEGTVNGKPLEKDGKIQR